MRRRQIIGTLINQPVVIPRLSSGDKVKFTSEHIIDVDVDNDIETGCDPA